jgi:hypothetical protein
VNQPEHYVSCMQVKVENGGSGTPGPVVQFPGAYKDTDPYATFSIYGGSRDFVFPGPAVWSSGGSGGGSSGGSEGGNSEGSEGGNSEGSEGGNSGGSEGGSDGGEEGANDDTGSGGGSCSGMYGQCGGNGWTGATCCTTGNCDVINEWYSQCI